MTVKPITPQDDRLKHTPLGPKKLADNIVTIINLKIMLAWDGASANVDLADLASAIHEETGYSESECHTLFISRIEENYTPAGWNISYLNVDDRPTIHLPSRPIIRFTSAPRPVPVRPEPDGIRLGKWKI